jgi:hypothetical protein
MDESYLKFMTVVMPLISAALVAIFGMIIFLFQKNIERELKYREEVEKRYENYLHSIFDVMANPTPENHAKFNKNQTSLRLFAPKEVLDLAKIFEDHASRTSIVENPKEVAASLLLAMRKDVTPKRRFGRALDLAEMQRINSFDLN